MPTRRTLLKITAAATLSALAPPILAAPKRSGTTSHFNPNRSKPMTATLHYQNAELSYQLGGKADAPAIVLLHGGLGSAEDFAPLLPRLQAHFRTLAIDTRGHGRSTRGDVPLTYAQTADDARQIIEAVGAVHRTKRAVANLAADRGEHGVQLLHQLLDLLDDRAVGEHHQHLFVTQRLAEYRRPVGVARDPAFQPRLDVRLRDLRFAAVAAVVLRQVHPLEGKGLDRSSGETRRPSSNQLLLQCPQCSGVSLSGSFWQEQSRLL